MLPKVRLYIVLCSFTVGIFVASHTAQAHRRSYAWTQEYHTLGQGEAELEYFLTTRIADLKKFDKKNSWEQQVELEYGFTDHFQMSVYQRAQHTHDSVRDGDFEYTGSKFEAKYRIAEKGQLPVDTTSAVIIAINNNTSRNLTRFFLTLISCNAP